MSSCPLALPLRAFLALAVAAMPVPAAAQQGTILRWKWSPGQVLRYRMNQEMRQEATGPAERDVSWTIQYVVRQEVRSVSDAGIATVEQTYESGTITAEERPGEKVRYDSANPADKDKAGHRLIAPYAAFIGRTITFDAGPEGQVPRLTGASAIIDEALGRLQTVPLSAMLLARFRESLGDEAMRKQLERALRIVPDRACSPGQTWTVGIDQDMPIVGTIHSEVTYRLDRLATRKGRRLAEISATGSLAQGAPAAGAAGGLDAMLGALVQMRLTRSEVSGDAVFDADEGRIERSGYFVLSEWEIGLKGADPGDALPGELGAPTGTQRIQQRARLELIP